MANSQLIYPEVYIKISEGQILTWRKETYSNLKDKKKYSKESIMNLSSSSIMSIEEIKNSIKNRLIMYQSTGILSNLESVFVIIDSCVLCKHALPTIISKFKKDYNLNDKNLILVISNINLTENYYKIQYKKNYPQVNFNRLMYNLNFIEGKKEFKMKNIIFLHTDIIFDNKVLIQEEVNFLHLNNNWSSKDRNEINDNAQLGILIHLNNMFSKDCYLISSDKRLLNKVDLKSQNIQGLFSYNFS